MRIVVLDGYTENPGDLGWGKLSALGELTVYDRCTPGDPAEVIRRGQELGYPALELNQTTYIE